MLKIINRMSVQLKWFLSYFSLFTIPIICTSVVFFIWVSDNQKSQAKLSYEVVINTFINTLDSKLTELDDFSMQISGSNWVSEFMNSTSQPNALTVKKFYNEFMLYNAVNSFYEDIGIYFHNHDMFIASNGYTDLEGLTSDVYNIQDNEWTGWDDIMASKHLPHTIKPVNVKTYGMKKHGILYFSSLPSRDYNRVRATLIAFIDSVKIKAMLDSVAIQDGISVYVIGQDNKLFTSYNGQESDVEAFELINHELSDYRKIEFDRTSNKRSHVFFGKSENSGFTCISVVPDTVMLKGLRLVRIILSTVVFISLVIGFLLSYVLSQNNYLPIKNIMKDLAKGHEKDIPVKAVNELSFIESVVNKMIKDESDLKSRLLQQKPVLDHYYLKKLISADYDNILNIHKALYLLDISFAHKMFDVGIIKASSADGNRDIKAYMQHAAMECGVSVFFIDEIKCSYVLSNFRKADAFSEFANMIRKFVQKRENITGLIGFGTIVHESEDLIKSYNSAKIAINYRVFGENANGVIVYDEISYYSSYYYPVDKENVLSNQLRSGDANNAVATVMEIINSNIREGEINIGKLKFLASNILFSCIKVLEEQNLTDEMDCLKADIQLFEDIEEIIDYVQNTCIEVCRISCKKSDDRRNDIIDSVLEYIEEKYDSYDFSLSMVAAKFNISDSHLSKIFKNSLKINFLDHINKRRLDKAIILLKKSELDIKEIAQEVGYSNDITFRRLFKKYHGVTPGNYRDGYGSKSSRDPNHVKGNESI